MVRLLPGEDWVFEVTHAAMTTAFWDKRKFHSTRTEWMQAIGKWVRDHSEGGVHERSPAGIILKRHGLW